MFHELTRSRAEGCVTDLQLDAWLGDELTLQEKTLLEAHVAVCDRCARRQKQWSLDREVFLRDRPAFSRDQPPIKALPISTTGPKRVTSTGSRSWLRSGGAVIVLAAASLLLVRLKPEGESSTRTKGGEQLGFFVKHGERVVEGYDGMRIAPGDALRFTYSAGSARYLAVLSRDAEGKASVYFPLGVTAARVEGGQNVALPVSVELDESVGREQLYAVFCDQSFKVQPYLEQLARSEAAPTPADGCSVRVLHIVKEMRE